jgi:DNA-directed RNA polymerase subunit RPC12/RpoP
MGQFCSEKCSEEWQDKNQKCIRCEKDMNLLEEQYTISQNGVLCQDCQHGGFSS